MKNLVIHGHFYQPPRENPWTGIIADQRGAAPFENWNEKIYTEAYEANAYSPLLDKNGLIERFYNNYSHISFNIGPTLMDWLRDHASPVYTKIIEADRESRASLGFGNAMAQVYNHMILPLASENDIKTQIEWGLENFRNHFGRDSEGLWLAETAINEEVAEALVRSRIRYTVLSPWQCETIRFHDNDREESRQFENEIWQKPWILETAAGPLTLFFYHPGLSTDLSFNHLLRDADYLFSRVCRELDELNAPTLSIASDGEIYGHHELLGNMGLSAFLNKVSRSEEYRMVNYSWLCSHSEAGGTVSLKKGDDRGGSSWSCSHGVSRWYRDCGCSTGGDPGWNQKWRTPLRNSLNEIADSADRIFEEGMKTLCSSDPWRIRNDYIRVLDSRDSPVDFFRKHGIRKDSDADRYMFFRLLEGQKFKMFMFTSCGWFFSDISGTETMQNLMYAARLIELYAPLSLPGTPSALLEHLAEAQSNIDGKGNGAVLYTGERIRCRKEIYSRALSLIVRELYKTDPSEPGCLRGQVGGNDRKILNMSNPLTGESWEIPFSLESRERLFRSITLYPGGREQVFGAEDLSIRDKLALMKSLCLEESERQTSISGKYSGIITQMDEWLRLRLPGSEDLLKSAEALLHYALREVTFLMEGGNREAWTCFQNLMMNNRTWQIPLPENLNHWLSSVLEAELLNRSERSAGLSRESILANLMVLLSAMRENKKQGIGYSLSGRIFEALGPRGTGKSLLASADRTSLSALKALLGLSEEIDFF